RARGMDTPNAYAQPGRQVVRFQVAQAPDVLQRQLQLSAADNALPRQDEKRRWGRFDEPLQSVPMGLWNFAQLFGRIKDKVENDEGKISVAQKKICCLDRLGRI